MSKIRNDIFPNMISFIQSKDKTISGYIDRAFEGISSMFSSKDELINYINSLDSYETAEIFIKICKFHSIVKKYQPRSYIKLIMVLSAIEKITSKDRPYIEFCSWITSKGQRKKITEELSKRGNITEKQFRKIIEKLREEYFTIYGSSRNVLDFFQNHLTIENKLKLIRSIRIKWTKVIHGFSSKTYNDRFTTFPTTIEKVGELINKEVRMGLVPYCYNWEDCWMEVNCRPSISCTLLEDSNILDQILKKVVRDIYQMRNDFVHNAKIVPLEEDAGIGVLAVLGKNRRPVSIKLTSKDLETIFENGLKHYFNKFTI